ncbi:MAG: response regulator transcription factor [bacterium]|nr:response regulator transcription factor [bacterium]
MYNRKRKILIVDDNPQYLHVLKTILDKDGYITITVDGGKPALLAVAEDKPDLILLDIMMDDMDGYEVCKVLKADKATASIPIIFLTSKTGIDDIVRGFETGAVDYVTKPFNAAELSARVKTHLDLKTAREEIRALRGILPICVNCKKIRDDKGFWEQVEVFIEGNSDAMFSHSICPDCVQRLYPDIKYSGKEK